MIETLSDLKEYMEYLGYSGKPVPPEVFKSFFEEEREFRRQERQFLGEIFSKWNEREYSLLQRRGHLLIIGEHPPLIPEEGEIYIELKDIKAAQKNTLIREEFSQLLWSKMMLSVVAYPGDIEIIKSNILELELRRNRDSESTLERIKQNLSGPHGTAVAIAYAKNVKPEHSDDDYAHNLVNTLRGCYEEYDKLITEKIKENGKGGPAWSGEWIIENIKHMELTNSAAASHLALQEALTRPAILAILDVKWNDPRELSGHLRQAFESGEIAALRNAVIDVLTLDINTLIIQGWHKQVLHELTEHPFVLALASLPEAESITNRIQLATDQLKQASQKHSSNDQRILIDIYKSSLIPTVIMNTVTEPAHPPVPIPELKQDIDDFIRNHTVLKEGGRFQFFSKLQLDHPQHHLNLYFRNMAGAHIADFSLATYQPDILLAIPVKKTIENHILSLRGIVEFHKPFRGGVFDPGWDDVLPPNTTWRLDKVHGCWNIKVTRNNQNQPNELGFSLGIQQDDPLLPEAIRRANFVAAYIALRYAQNANARVTKEQARDDLRVQLAEHPGNQTWQGADSMRSNYPGGNLIPLGIANSHLRVKTMTRVGDPNLAWTLPFDILWSGTININGTPETFRMFKVGGAAPNLHVNDSTVGRARGHEVFDNLVGQFAEFPANTGWNLEWSGNHNRWQLADESRDINIGQPNQQHLIGQRELQIIFHRLPNYKNDLKVSLRGSNPDPRMEGHTRYTLGVNSGQQNNVTEPRLEKLQGTLGPTSILAREIRFPTQRIGEIGAFLGAVRARFDAYTRSAYNTHTDANFDQFGQARRRTINKYTWHTARDLLEEAICDTRNNLITITVDRPLTPQDVQTIQQAHGQGNFTWIEYLGAPQQQQAAAGDNDHANGPPPPPNHHKNIRMPDLYGELPPAKTHLARLRGGHAIPGEWQRF